MEEGIHSWKNKDETVDFVENNNEKYWLLNECSRTDAEVLLYGLPNGTFLIRRRRAGHYALSIVCNSINHCIIYETERGYGFAEPYNIYDTLLSLVLHYSHNSLEEHNDSLTTTLKYPILCTLILQQTQLQQQQPGQTLQQQQVIQRRQHLLSLYQQQQTMQQ